MNQSEETKTVSVTCAAEASDDGKTEKVETLLQIDDPEEKAAVEAAKKKILSMGSEPRIIATSPATADICDKLNLDLVGVCSSAISSIPERYADVETVGGARAGYGNRCLSEPGLDFKPGHPCSLIYSRNTKLLIRTGLS